MTEKIENLFKHKIFFTNPRGYECNRREERRVRRVI